MALGSNRYHGLAADAPRFKISDRVPHLGWSVAPVDDRDELAAFNQAGEDKQSLLGWAGDEVLFYAG